MEITTEDAQGPGVYSNKMKQDDEGVKQGIGSIIPIPKHNIYNKGNHKIPYTFKQVWTDDITFESGEGAYAIPYQTLQFWFWQSRSTEVPYKTNMENGQNINLASWGCVLKQGRISADVLAVTRKRLLQTGTTNTETWDFETSQNMIIAESDRKPEFYEISDISSASAYRPKNVETANPGYMTAQDMATITEVPQRMRYTKYVNFVQPPHGHVMDKLPVFTSNEIRNAYIPGKLKYRNAGPWTANNTDALEQHQWTSPGTTENRSIVAMDSFMGSAIYPQLAICQPIIPDETGHMAFRYQVRFETEIDVEFYLYPEGVLKGIPTNALQGINIGQINRFKMPWTLLTVQADKITVPCLPFDCTS